MVTLPHTPSIVRGRLRHTRHRPFRHSLSFATYMWLVDLGTDLPRSALASFPSQDHFGGSARTIREAASSFAQAQGAVVAHDDRLLMLSSARSLGHAFNPLSVYWCFTANQEVRWVIMEIHNTYGDRHAHLVVPDSRGQVEFAKEFYVSPFYTVDGGYRVRLRLDEEAVSIGIQLRQADHVVFSGSFAGQPRPATAGHLLRAALRTPFVAYQTTLRIRVHGIWLWLRRLPVVPRPAHEPPGGMR